MRSRSTSKGVALLRLPRRALRWAAGPAALTCVAGVLVLAVSAAAGGCRQEGILVDSAPAVDTTGRDGPPTVQRADLRLTLRLDSRDSSVWRALGWTDGLVPNATIVLRRMNSMDSELTAETDTQGAAAFTRLLPGEYSVSAVRLISPAEAQALSPDVADVDAVAGGDIVGVVAPQSSQELGVNAGHRGSLVVSELLRDTQTSGVFYPFGGYLELYNNSDTTIYVDGKLVGEGGVDVYSDGPNFPCAPYQSYRTDSLGLWTRMVYRFPGSGTDYPLAPGRAVVIATDAVDHREVRSDLDDLSSADFEFVGPADADNPSVPNMINVGPSDWALGHGLFFFSTQAWPYVATSVDVASLPSSRLLNLPYTYVRIPRSAVLDLGVLFLAPSFDYPSPLCEPQVHPSLDRQYARVMPLFGDNAESVQRKVLRTLPDGRRVLLRTKTSSRDFTARAPRTPGRVP